MNVRLDELRGALEFLRRARTSLDAGRPGWAIEDLRQAQARLSFTYGAFPGSMGCTGGLRWALFRFERRLVREVETMRPLSTAINRKSANDSDG